MLAVWEIRAELKRAIRDFFVSRRYLEIDTPIAVTCPGTEVHLRYFETHWVDFKDEAHRLFLRSSPELHMKQALAAGATRIFQIAPCFRNGGELSPWHQPEFSMLEYYEAGISFEDFICLTEALLRETHARVAPLVKERLRGTPITLPKTFPRLTVKEAFQEFARVKLTDQDPDFGQKARAAGVISVTPDDDFETAFFKTLIEKVEPGLLALGGAVLVDYPISQAALAAVREGVAKRFEFYLGRVELCNGFEELLDADANRQRVRDALARRSALGLPLVDEDHAFYAALESGLPPCSGNALGFDRWLALLLGDQCLDRAVPFRRAGPYSKATP